MFGLVLKKPLALACTAFLAVLLVLLLCPVSFMLPLAYCLLTLLLIGIGFFFFTKRERWQRILFLSLLFLAALALAVLLAGNHNAHKETLKATYHEQEALGRFLVTDVTNDSQFCELEGVFLTLNEKEVNIQGTIVTFNRSLSARAGDIVEGYVTLEITEGDSFLNKQEMASGKLLLGETTYFDIVDENVITPAVLLSRIRSFVSSTLEDHLSHNGSAMAKALLLADKSEIPSSVKEGFSSLGIQHLFAVSGLHLSILIGSIASLFSHFAIKRRIAFPILSAITLFYMALTGFTPSMLRSGGMLLLFYFSFFSHRHRDSVTALFVATSLIVLISPTSILDVGLLLSFLATLGILLMANPILTKLFQKRIFYQERWLPRILSSAAKSVISSLALSLSATAFILPVLYAMKSKVVVFTFLSNLVFTPFFTLLLYCVPALFLCLFFPVLIPLLTWIVNLLADIIYALATGGKSFASLSFSLNYRFMPWLILLLFISLALFILKKKYNLLPLLMVVLFFITANVGISITNYTQRNSEMVYYHTNNRSDSLLLYTDQRGMVVDFSYSAQFILESFDTIENEFPSVKTDTLMLTNCRAAHVKTVKTLIERNGIRHLFLPQGNANAEKLYQYLKERDFDVIYYTPQDTLFWNDISLTTYQDKTYYNVSAVEIKLSHQKLLYLKENAPTIFNIRFGVMQDYHDVVFYGGFGLKSRYDPYHFNAPIVVQGHLGDYLEENKDSTLLFGDYLVKDTKE